MAKITTVTVSDDLDGTKDAETISFSFKNTAYEVDLSSKNQAALEKALRPYIDAGRKVSSRGMSGAGRGRGSRSSLDLSKVREWAQSQGIEVASRGRIAASVIEQYEAAN